MRGRSSGKTAPPVPGLTRVGGGAIMNYRISLNLIMLSINGLAVNIIRELSVCHVSDGIVGRWPSSSDSEVPKCLASTALTSGVWAMSS